MLLREYVGAWLARRRAPRAAQVIDREPPNRFILRVERYLRARRRGGGRRDPVCGSAAFGIVKGGHVDEFTTALERHPACAGQCLPWLPHHHRRHQRPQQLSQTRCLRSAAVNGRSSLLFLDAATVRDR